MASPEPKFKTIVITSIPGADWDESTGQTFAEVFQERLKSGFSVDSEVFQVRRMIYELASEESIFLQPNQIHRSSDEKIRLLRRLAFQEVQQRISNSSAGGQSPLRVIKTRAISYSSHSKEESLTGSYLRGIGAQLLAAVIDDPIDIYKRIPKRTETKKYGRLRIDDLVGWMELEVSEMERLSHELSCPLFIIPRRQVSALVDLVMTNKQPAYASYPMTKADDDNLRGKIAGFVQRLKEKFVVFDPACMGSAHTEVPMEDREWLAYRENILKRDEQWFIRINSRSVIVYLPALLPAHGSQSELVAASEQGKTVWVVLEPEYSNEHGKLSPFLDRPADHVFISSDEFSYFLALNEKECGVYGFILDLMWRFKGRGELTPLRPATSDAHADGQATKVMEKFSNEVLRLYSREVSRDMVPVLEEQRIKLLIQACWDFNKPLWQAHLAAREIPKLFHEPERLPLAARSGALASSTETQSAPFKRGPNLRNEEAPGLSDEEAFAAFFPSYVVRKDGALFFEGLRKFFDEGDLGSFQNRAPFLRFLGKTLKVHKPKSLRSVERNHFKRWFREFNEGAEIGSWE